MTGKPTHDDETLAFLLELLAEHAGLVTGRMFGFPALYYVDPDQLTATGSRQKRHLLLTVTQAGIALRVPEYLLDDLLSEPEYEPFAPFNMPVLKGWVLIRRECPGAYSADLELLETALAELTSAARRQPR